MLRATGCPKSPQIHSRQGQERPCKRPESPFQWGHGQAISPPPRTLQKKSELCTPHGSYYRRPSLFLPGSFFSLMFAEKKGFHGYRLPLPSSANHLPTPPTHSQSPPSPAVKALSLLPTKLGVKSWNGKRQRCASHSTLVTTGHNLRLLSKAVPDPSGQASPVCHTQPHIQQKERLACKNCKPN